MDYKYEKKKDTNQFIYCFIYMYNINTYKFGK